MDGVIPPDAARDRRAVGRGLTAFVALPAESPLPMPAQSFEEAPISELSRPPSAPRDIVGRRILVLGSATVLGIAATYEMAQVLDGPLLNLPAITLLGLFAMLFAWIALAFISALAGFVVLLRDRPHALMADGDTGPLQSRTALLIPVYNEQPSQVFGALEAMHAALVDAGEAHSFDFFVLSDTTDPDVWVAEEAMLLAIRERCPGSPGIYYRRRRENAERKVGNLRDWVTRFGGAYEHFLVLDADSVMDPSTLVRLVAAMERHVDVGLIQTLPISVGGQTVLARVQQFAGRIHGALVAAGATWWQGAECNYYGHNAIIRTRAFAAAAGLPPLRGRKPFGGHILSHDFIEAALLRRAGWAVHMVPLLRGSYEQGPPTLIDIAVRDRRWCQGNLQHAALLAAAGFHPISRLHLLTGIGAYLTAPLWLAFLLGGIVLSLEAHLSNPVYFPEGHALFPDWPQVDPIRAKWMFIATMLLLIVPKVLAAIAFLRDARNRRAVGGAGRLMAGMVVELLVSGLLAPVTMLTQSRQVVSILLGRDGGWTAQRRDSAAVSWREAAARYWGHTSIGIALSAAFLLSPALALWMSPVILGLVLAIPLVVFTGNAAIGQALSKAGILTTPEENVPPIILVQANARRARLQMREPGSGEAVSRLAHDDALLALHRRLLTPSKRPGHDRIDLKLATGRAKMESVDDLPEVLRLLDRDEKAALLGDAAAVRKLVSLARVDQVGSDIAAGGRSSIAGSHRPRDLATTAF